jgi:hypothetical protein
LQKSPSCAIPASTSGGICAQRAIAPSLVRSLMLFLVAPALPSLVSIA